MEQTETPMQDDLLIKYLTGNASEEERANVLTWIHQDNTNQFYFEKLRDIYEASLLANPKVRYKSDLSWEKVRSMYYSRQYNKIINSNKNERLFYIREIIKYAAIIFVFISIGVYGLYYFKKSSDFNNQIVWNVVEAPFGSRSSITLSDGSKVNLNAGSKLKYSNTFGNKVREVFLEGEAYFDVTKFKKEKFIVRTGFININVLGTAFNVKAYPGENTIQTTLVRGSITIIGDHSNSINFNKEIYLKPNQSITYIKDTKLYQKVKDLKKELKNNTIRKDENVLLLPNIDPVVYTSWKDDRWIIQGEKLSDLAIKLGRRYNIKFQFDTESLKEYKFTGILRDETVEQVLKLMKFSAPIEYSIKENMVVFSENKSFKKSYDQMLNSKK